MHPESSISLFNETAPYRRPLLRLPIVFRYPESLQFPRRTNQRDFRLYKNAAANAEALAAWPGRSRMGRRSAAEASGTATRVQGDAQRNAQAHDPAARVHSQTHTFVGL